MPIRGGKGLALVAVGVQCLPAPGLAAAGSRSSFESVLRHEVGWTGNAVCQLPAVASDSNPDGSIIVPPSLASVQYHSQRHLVAEVVAGFTPKGQHDRCALFSQSRLLRTTRLWYSTTFVEALVSYGALGLSVRCRTGRAGVALAYAGFRRAL